MDGAVVRKAGMVTEGVAGVAPATAGGAPALPELPGLPELPELPELPGASMQEAMSSVTVTTAMPIIRSMAARMIQQAIVSVAGERLTVIMGN